MLRLPGLLFPGLFQSFLPSGFAIFRKEGLLIGHEFLHPQLALRPHVRQVHDDSRPVGVFQQFQTRTQDFPLIFNVMGPARRVAKRIVEKNLPGVAGMGGDVPRIGEGDRRDASFLQDTSDQTHGLVTDRSDGRQQGRIHLVLQALAKDFRSVHFDRLTMAVIGQGPVEVLAQAAEYPFLEKLL
jgi:hypothetical protein